MGGKECAVCGREKASRSNREAHAALFVERAQAVHGNTYDYSSSIYTKGKEPIIVTCRLHGDFKTTPSNHINTGNGCPECARIASRHTRDEVLEKARSIHGDKYDYTNFQYTEWEEKAEIICKDHGSFLQTPHGHCRGNGCPACRRTGYDDNKPGTLYVLEFGNVTKIGITNRDVKKRVTQIKTNSGKKFEVVTQFNFEDGKIPNKLETVLILELRKLYEQPSEKYDGSTESFLDLDVPSLLSRIRELSKEFTE